MKIILNILEILILGLTFVIFYNNKRIREGINESAVIIDKQLKTKESFYKKVETFILKMGIRENFNIDLTPTTYIFINVICAILGAIVFAKIDIKFSVLGLLAYFIPSIVLKISNHIDNEEIVSDVSNMYDTLRIQAKAGVYITNSLADCYLVVKNERLKRALLELNNYIILKSEIEDGIDIFNSKFDCKEINTFCVVIKQGIQSGHSVELLNDLSKQIEDIDNAKKMKLQESIKTKLAFNQLMIYVALIGIVLYGIIKSLTTTLSIF